MAMGEWVSVQSSLELYQRELPVERAEIASFPEEERCELATIEGSDFGLGAPLSAPVARTAEALAEMLSCRPGVNGRSAAYYGPARGLLPIT